MQQTSKKVIIPLGPRQRRVTDQKSTFCSKRVKQREDFVVLSVTTRGSLSKRSKGSHLALRKKTSKKCNRDTVETPRYCTGGGRAEAQLHTLKCSPATEDVHVPHWQHWAGRPAGEAPQNVGLS